MSEEREALSLFSLLDISLCAENEREETFPSTSHARIHQIPKNSKIVTWLKLRVLGTTELWGRCVCPIG